MEKMRRREAIKRSSMIMGGALSGSMVAGVLAGCQAEPALDWLPKVLTPDQALVVADLVERILPATATPGAKEAHVDRFIDSMLEGYLPERELNTFIEGLTVLKNRKFIKKTPEEQDKLIGELADAARKQGKNTETKSFFILAKEMTLLGFFTSKVGATEVLNYDPVPGAYLGCRPLVEVGGKTWAQ